MSAPDSDPGSRSGKPVRESRSEYAELALPTDANGLGNVLGGKVMHLVDLAGAMAAMRHARKPVVTASFDHMNFLHPIRIGQLIVLLHKSTGCFTPPWKSA
jgi:acyl-CoA hydrolase